MCVRPRLSHRTSQQPRKPIPDQIMSTPATETQSSTGLAQPFKPSGNGTKRPAAKQLPAHIGKIWSAVTITGKEYTTNPMVTCNYCDHQFSGGASRIADHIRDKCKCKDDDRKEEFLGLKKQLIAEKETKDGRAAAKTAAAEVEEAADQAEKKPRVGMEYEVKTEFKQKGIAASFRDAKGRDVW